MKFLILIVLMKFVFISVVHSAVYDRKMVIDNIDEYPVYVFARSDRQGYMIVEGCASDGFFGKHRNLEIWFSHEKNINPFSKNLIVKHKRISTEKKCYKIYNQLLRSEPSEDSPIVLKFTPKNSFKIISI